MKGYAVCQNCKGFTKWLYHDHGKQERMFCSKCDQVTEHDCWYFITTQE